MLQWMTPEGNFSSMFKNLSQTELKMPGVLLSKEKKSILR